MGKKRKEEKVEKFPIDKEVASFEAKYTKILPFVDASLVRRLYETSIPSNTRENGVSWNLNASFTVEKKFFLALKELVLEGDIDLEIAIIDQFMSIGRMLIKRLGYQGDDLEHKVETAITQAIENYPGNDGFKSTILKELKDLVREKEEVVPPVESEEVPVEEAVSSASLPIEKLEEEKLEVREGEELTVPTLQPVEEIQIVLPNDGKLRPATTLDQLLANIDILKVTPLDDAIYIKFLALKYGYYEGQFFSLGEISEILSIPMEKTREYYLQSLQFVKDWFGLQLERYYTYLKTNGKENG